MSRLIWQTAKDVKPEQQRLTREEAKNLAEQVKVVLSGDEPLKNSCDGIVAFLCDSFKDLNELQRRYAIAVATSELSKYIRYMTYQRLARQSKT